MYLSAFKSLLPAPGPCLSSKMTQLRINVAQSATLSLREMQWWGRMAVA
jgi:hypothetical protein